MKSFEIFLSLLATIPDPRRAEGRLYQLPHILLFSILGSSQNIPKILPTGSGFFQRHKHDFKSL